MAAHHAPDHRALTGRLPAELVDELAELVDRAERLERLVADLAHRYDALRRWDAAWPERPDDPGTLDGDVLEAAGDNRVRALLSAIAAHAVEALEDRPMTAEQLRAHGLDGFEVRAGDEGGARG